MSSIMPPKAQMHLTPFLDVILTLLFVVMMVARPQIQNIKNKNKELAKKNRVIEEQNIKLNKELEDKEQQLTELKEKTKQLQSKIEDLNKQTEQLHTKIKELKEKEISLQQELKKNKFSNGVLKDIDVPKGNIANLLVKNFLIISLCISSDGSTLIGRIDNSKGKQQVGIKADFPITGDLKEDYQNFLTEYLELPEDIKEHSKEYIFFVFDENMSVDQGLSLEDLLDGMLWTRINTHIPSWCK